MSGVTRNWSRVAVGAISLLLFFSIDVCAGFSARRSRFLCHNWICARSKSITSTRCNSSFHNMLTSLESL